MDSSPSSKCFKEKKSFPCWLPSMQDLHKTCEHVAKVYYIPCNFLPGYSIVHIKADSRKRDSESITDQYPDKIPLIIERYRNEKALPVLEKIKYLVPYDMTVGTLCSIIRKRLQLNSTQTLFLLVNDKNMFSASMSLVDIYRDEKDEDGFLYFVYASQEVFGSCQ